MKNFRFVKNDINDEIAKRDSIEIDEDEPFLAMGNKPRQLFCSQTKIEL